MILGNGFYLRIIVLSIEYINMFIEFKIIFGI